MIKINEAFVTRILYIGPTVKYVARGSSAEWKDKKDFVYRLCTVEKVELCCYRIYRGKPRIYAGFRNTMAEIALVKTQAIATIWQMKFTNEQAMLLTRSYTRECIIKPVRGNKNILAVRKLSRFSGVETSPPN